MCACTIYEGIALSGIKLFVQRKNNGDEYKQKKQQ